MQQAGYNHNTAARRAAVKAAKRRRAIRNRIFFGMVLLFLLAGTAVLCIKIFARPEIASYEEPEAFAELPDAKDNLAPVITGTRDITVSIGEVIAYKAGVAVSDDTDPRPVLTVDASAVNLGEPGTYPVIYTATDASGNACRTSINVTVTAKKASDEDLGELLDLARQMVDETVDKTGSEIEQIYDAFCCIKDLMTYTGQSDKSSWISEGIRGFKDLCGDCFTYFAMMKAMLTAMGYETVDVTREGGKTRHYWSLVKYNGEWYHIDSCPRSPQKNCEWYCFLRTDEELLEWNKQFSPDDEGYGYYNFDAFSYPESSKVKLDLGRMQNELLQ